MAEPANRSGIAAIIVAAGAGRRFGQPKHALTLRGKPLWRWSVDTFEGADLAEIIVVGDVPGGIPGGTRRRDSVLAGLVALRSDPEWVLVHDAARPLVSSELVASVLAAVAVTGADGVVPGVPVTDTIKRTEGDRIVDTVDRARLIAVQTPQAFRTRVLERAHRGSPGEDATDDAALVERIGGTVTFVTGERDNMKITFPIDLVVADRILEERPR